MNVSLTPELEALVTAKVQSGRHYSASEVIPEGLRLMQEKDMLRQIKLEQLRKDLMIGIDSANRGELAPLDIEAIITEGRKMLAKRTRK